VIYVRKLLHQIFKKLYGKPSWNVHRGYSSFITFEFGKPKLKVLKKVFIAGQKFRIQISVQAGSCSW